LEKKRPPLSRLWRGKRKDEAWLLGPVTGPRYRSGKWGGEASRGHEQLRKKKAGTPNSSSRRQKKGPNLTTAIPPDEKKKT